jgi:hypothetical protein
LHFDRDLPIGGPLLYCLLTDLNPAYPVKSLYSNVILTLKKERMKTTSSSNLSAGAQNAITAIVFVVLIMLVNYLNISA